MNVGQRGGDAIQAKWTDLKDNGISITQSKTGAQIWIPFSATLKDLLEKIPKRAATILTGPGGKPWLHQTLVHRIQAQMQVFGVEGYSLHGLRYNAAENLAAAGCSLHQIAAITGHKTLSMVQKYTAKGDQKRLAKTAISMLDGALIEKNKVTPQRRKGAQEL